MLFFWKKKTKRSDRARTKDVQQKAFTSDSQYHAVAIKVDLIDSCAEAQKLRGVRFLSAEAPKLPLPGCDCKNCGCKYQHFKDRRSYTRRDIDAGLPEKGAAVDNGRRSKGRRKTDV